MKRILTKFAHSYANSELNLKRLLMLYKRRLTVLEFNVASEKTIIFVILILEVPGMDHHLSLLKSRKIIVL